MRVLIVKTSSMGDVIHTLPALTDAMRAYPNIQFDWVIEENFSQIPHWHPAVKQVLPLALRRWRKHWFGAQQREERCRFRRDLQQRHYDIVIDAQGLIKSAALVTRLAQGRKHGGDSRSARESLASFWYDCRHAINQKQHAVERIRDLFASSLNYTKPQRQGEYAIAPHFMTDLPHDERQYLVFLHATTRDNKHWPESHWRHLLALLASSGLQVKLPWGTDHEQQRALRLAAGFQHVLVLPRLSLAEVAHQLAGAQAIVSVDTGLSHLAAALDRVNITLYGPTDPRLIGGYGKHQLALRPEQGNRMADIQSSKVFRALQLSLTNSMLDSSTF